MQDRLTALNIRTVDAFKGCLTMAQKAEPVFRDVAQRFATVHAYQAALLSSDRAGIGTEVNQGGPIIWSINRVVAAVRAFCDAIDKDVMDQIRDGEGWMLTAFDDTIAASDGAQDAGRLPAQLRKTRGELGSLLLHTCRLG